MKSLKKKLSNQEQVHFGPDIKQENGMVTGLKILTFLLYYLQVFFLILLIYFWLCWVFIAVRGLSRVAVGWAGLPCGAPASHSMASRCSA